MPPIGDEHADRFLAVERRVGKLETDVAVIQREQLSTGDLAKEVRELGKTVLKFVTDHDAREDEQKKSDLAKHSDNQRKLDRQNVKTNIVIAICAVATAILGVAVFIYTVEVHNHAEMDPARIFHSFVKDVQLAQSRLEKKIAGDDGIRSAPPVP
jgi:hypothetical protein